MDSQDDDVVMRHCCHCCCWQKSGQMDSQDDKVLRWDIVIVVVDRSQVRWTHKVTKCWDETLLLLLLLTEVRSDGLTRWLSVEMRHCYWQKSGQMDSQGDKVLRWDVVVVLVVDRSQVRWTHKMTKCWDETLLLTEVRSDGLTGWLSVEMRRCCCCCWQKSVQMDSQDDKVLRWDIVVVVVDRSQFRWTHKMTKCWDGTLLLLLLLLTEVRSDGLTRWLSVEMRRCCCCCYCWQKSVQMDSQDD